MARIRKDEAIPIDGRKVIAERSRADRRYAQKRKDIDKYNSVSEETRKLYHDIERRNLYANMIVELNEEICTMPSGFPAFRTQKKKGIAEAQEYLRSVGIERKEKETDFKAIRNKRTNELLEENIALLTSRGLDPFSNEREEKPKTKRKTKKDPSEIKISKVINNFSEAEMEILFNIYNQKNLIK
ncbi:TPA: hypothetical protein ACN7B3_005020 [Klebsiella pneumoniae]|uniref:hypothetical protein n=1 Tax=Klebsiella pneumoniae TaxID=573 RepID=UPI000E2B0950|nr:hypothetical protein [Klebsiella pneumoniae]MBC4676281.1 hypothetical protein [Klebsiella pneumoniae]MBX4492366.1 hypothetical protein [Klebsiella pneumoniae]MBX4494549.1 hypothetical protein [Klebsiella pneumoniae]MBX4681678.1 hypothetical protein [Klebsiella pneumoniae]MBZ1994407.1 hypothetical protein [Klebsiella pneumoniae]